ncbi:uncharacterized protein LOC144547205 [Carex rostrata]
MICISRKKNDSQDTDLKDAVNGSMFHLDSASYRTLSRIFSVCRELSHKPLNPNPNAILSSADHVDQTSDPGKFENPKLDEIVETFQSAVEKIDSVEPRNPNPNANLSSVADEDQTRESGKFENAKLGETVETLQMAEKRFGSMEPENPNSNATLSSVADGNQTTDPRKIEDPMLDETVKTLQLVMENIDSMDELEIDVFSNSERLNSVVSDLSLLVGCPGDQIQSGSGEFAPDKQMRDEADRKLSLVGELNHEKDQNQQAEVDNILVHKIETGNDSLLDSNCQEMALDKEIEQLGEEESLKGDPYQEAIEAGFVETMELSLKIGEGVQLDPPNEISKLGSSNQDKPNGAIEEGEITDDAQDLDDDSDLDKEVEPLIDDESEQDLINTRSDEKLAIKEDIPGLEHENVASQSPGIDSSKEAYDIGKKRKKILSSERQAKKKKAYRIKRAKKLREDGVNRLRLPPPGKKEKEKKICKFYLQGKCQQEELCKFSHDVTPVTKSKACSHFARGECLKGDECPYDHDLSKYPCHKFVSERMCVRGANCKFSHNIQNTEVLSVQTKESGEELSEKSNMGKQTNTSQKSSTVKCTPVDTFKRLNPCLIKSIEAPLKVPKGVRFLSFGADTKQEKLSDAKPATKQKPHLAEQNLRNVKNKERENLVSEAAGVSGTGELSEASKILQEYLFCALSTAI